MLLFRSPTIHRIIRIKQQLIAQLSPNPSLTCGCRHTRVRPFVCTVCCFAQSEKWAQVAEQLMRLQVNAMLTRRGGALTVRAHTLGANQACGDALFLLFILEPS